MFTPCGRLGDLWLTDLGHSMRRMDRGGRSPCLQVKRALDNCRSQRNHDHRLKCDFMASSPGGPRISLYTSKDKKNRRPWDIKTTCFGSHGFHHHLKIKNIAAYGQYLRSDWGALVGRYGIDVENH